MRELLVRADAGPEIGAGHVMRTLALAQGLRRATGCGVTFLSCLGGRGDQGGEALAERIRAAGCTVLPLDPPHPDPGDLSRTLAELDRRKDAWLVLDGYHFGPEYQRAVRASGHPLLLFDDCQHQERYHADIILNQNIGAEALAYRADPDTLVLAGLDYVSLRPEFLAARPERAEAPERAREVLLTMGGADPGNVTSAALQGLLAAPVDGLVVRVVIGPSNAHARALEALLRGRTGFEAVRGADMPALMAGADMALTAAGSTCWELAYMGVPMLCVVLADNQENIARGLDERGAARSLGRASGLGPEGYARAVRELAQDRAARQSMLKASRSLVDGRGPERIAAAMKDKSA